MPRPRLPHPLASLQFTLRILLLLLTHAALVTAIYTTVYIDTKLGNGVLYSALALGILIDNAEVVGLSFGGNGEEGGEANEDRQRATQGRRLHIGVLLTLEGARAMALLIAGLILPPTAGGSDGGRGHEEVAVGRKRTRVNGKHGPTKMWWGLLWGMVYGLQGLQVLTVTVCALDAFLYRISSRQRQRRTMTRQQMSQQGATGRIGH